MKEHFLITVSAGQLRIFSEIRTPARFHPRLELVEADDPHAEDSRPSDGIAPLRRRGARERPVARVEPFAGRRAGGRRTHLRLARRIEEFLQRHAHSSWDLAAPTAVYRALMSELSPEVQRRLKRVLSERVAHEPAERLRTHFSLTA